MNLVVKSFVLFAIWIRLFFAISEANHSLIKLFNWLAAATPAFSFPFRRFLLIRRIERLLLKLLRLGVEEAMSCVLVAFLLHLLAIYHFFPLFCRLLFRSLIRIVWLVAFFLHLLAIHHFIPQPLHHWPLLFHFFTLFPRLVLYIVVHHRSDVVFNIVHSKDTGVLIEVDKSI